MKCWNTEIMLKMYRKIGDVYEWMAGDTWASVRRK